MGHCNSRDPLREVESLEKIKIGVQRSPWHPQVRGKVGGIQFGRGSGGQQESLQSQIVVGGSRSQSAGISRECRLRLQQP